MTLRERFEAKFARCDGCWLWTASRDTDGYGQFRVGGRMQKAHRVSWELTNGLIPEGMFVCHRCDTPACVNPDHLFLGWPADNTADMVAKGRGVQPILRGEANSRAKLTAETALAIFQASGPQREIAELYGVGQPIVSKVRLGHVWAHVTGATR